jgi:hypothetical protein
MKHYLLTIAIAANAHMHGYLIAPDDRYAAHAIDELFEAATQAGCRPFEIALQTSLSTDDSRQTVRAIVSQFEEAKQALLTADEYHLSIWAMLNDHPDDKRLMKLH